LIEDDKETETESQLVKYKETGLAGGGFRENLDTKRGR